jgi:hypothetical protein
MRKKTTEQRKGKPGNAILIQNVKIPWLSVLIQ